MPTGTLRDLPLAEALERVARGAAFVDLRPIRDYLDVHIPGSLGLLYESGPGMAGRARDCVPLEVPLILADEGAGDVVHAASSLRGKGFTVLGAVGSALEAWAREHGTPASTETATGRPPPGTALDVGDPGARAPDGALRVPLEHLWGRAEEVAGHAPLVIASGYGVRAALAVGMLERAGVRDIVVWQTEAAR